LGKNREACSALGRALQKRRMLRFYLAVLEGLAAADQFTIEAAIGLQPHPRLGPIHAASAGGKPSRTDFRVLDRDAASRTTLVQAAPHTGRTHQIRIHAAVAGHPLAGEPFYVVGGRWDDEAALRSDRIPLPGDCGYRLHAWRLQVAHPRSREALHLECSPPPGFWVENGRNGRGGLIVPVRIQGLFDRGTGPASSS
jgi:23S rRNA pseudouridine1911/1915/1917 synthase